MTVTVHEILSAIEEAAPLRLQEEWDNCGLIVGSADKQCTGVMLALDVTPSVIAQACARGCNLVISHHPLIFKGIRSVNDTTPQGEALIAAIKSDIAVYCSHTALDNAPAPYGVSCMMAEMLQAEVVKTMTDSGTGVLARLPHPVSCLELAEDAKSVFTAKGIRIGRECERKISDVVLGSGSCGFLIPEAVREGAQAIITSDVRYHDFLDYGNDIFIIDLTHFDTEKCTKEIFKRIISQKFANFADVFCASEPNPIEYL